MLTRLLKNWTLPVAIAVGTLAYLLFAFTPGLEPAAAILGPLMETLLPVCIFLTLFVTFAKVDFHKMRLHRWQAAILFMQLVLVCALLWTIAHLTQREHILTLEAVLVCVIAPCAAASPVVTAKLGGDLTQMTTFVLLSSFIAALLIPAVFPLVEPRAQVAFLPAFLAIFRRLALVLLLPLLLAAIVRHRVRRFSRRSPLSFLHTPDLGFYIWCCSLAITSGITVKNIIHSDARAATLAAIALLSLLTAILQFAIGRTIGHRIGRPVCCGQGMFQKNTGLAIWIAYTYLTPIASLGAGCYVLWQNIINSYELWQQRHNGK